MTRPAASFLLEVRMLRAEGCCGQLALLLDAAELAELMVDRPRAMLASELSIEEIERMLSAPVSAECGDLDLDYPCNF